MSSANYIVEAVIVDHVFATTEVMYKDYERCTFTGCDFTVCDFSGTVFIDCKFVRCNFDNAKINYVALRDVVFVECNFTSVNFAMVDTLLFGVSFSECKLDYSKFYTLKLKGSSFIDCSMVAVDFMKSDLTDVLFDNCDLYKSVFLEATASKADFSTSYNFSIDPEKTKLKRAVFSQEGLKGLLHKYDLIVK
ncbi:MAG TPA: pentapeptide repeat-containing protein [Flavobacterium sp.]|jgi:uncharacterized protein YjbI with pentapeptide repeats